MLIFGQNINPILYPSIGNLITHITIFSDLLSASLKISCSMVFPLTSGKLKAYSSKLGTPDLITNVKSEIGIWPELQKEKNNLNKVIIIPNGDSYWSLMLENANKIR